MTRGAALAAACALLLGCGRYGPPVRASEEPKPEKKRSFEIPLPGADPSEPAPAAPAQPEEEPPPEGAP